MRTKLSLRYVFRLKSVEISEFLKNGKFQEKAEKLKAEYEVAMEKYNKENGTKPEKVAKSEKTPKAEKNAKTEKTSKSDGKKGEKSKESDQKFHFE